MGWVRCRSAAGVRTRQHVGSERATPARRPNLGPGAYGSRLGKGHSAAEARGADPVRQCRRHYDGALDGPAGPELGRPTVGGAAPDRQGAGAEFVKKGLMFTGEAAPMLNLMPSVMEVCAEFERSLFKEREHEGIALVKARGSLRGPRSFHGAGGCQRAGCPGHRRDPQAPARQGIADEQGNSVPVHPRWRSFPLLALKATSDNLRQNHVGKFFNWEKIHRFILSECRARLIGNTDTLDGNYRF